MDSTNKAKTARKPLLALTAAFLMPGFGQLYNGEYSKGLAFFLSLAFTLPVAAWLGLHGPESLLWIFILLGVLLALFVYVIAIVDAYRSAKRIGDSFTPKPLNTAPAYVATLFFGYVFVLSQMTLFTKDNLVEAYYIPSQSMVPNLLSGDRIFVDKRINRPGANESVHRGDMAIFVNPNNRTQIYVKRVIGLPGDKIEIKNMSVLVNGRSISGVPINNLGSNRLNQLLSDHVAVQEQGDAGSYFVIWKRGIKHNDYSVTVPNGHVFVLGDNRDASQDSRHVGPIPLVDIIAKAKQVWWSYSVNEGVRWNRLGRLLD